MTLRARVCRQWLAAKKAAAAEEAEQRRLEAEANTLVGPTLPAAMVAAQAAAAAEGPGEGQRGCAEGLGWNSWG